MTSSSSLISNGAALSSFVYFILLLPDFLFEFLELEECFLFYPRVRLLLPVFLAGKLFLAARGCLAVVSFFCSYILAFYLSSWDIAII
jgi:hypothetical protein